MCTFLLVILLCFPLIGEDQFKLSDYVPVDKKYHTLEISPKLDMNHNSNKLESKSIDSTAIPLMNNNKSNKGLFELDVTHRFNKSTNNFSISLWERFTSSFTRVYKKNQEEKIGNILWDLNTGEEIITKNKSSNKTEETNGNLSFDLYLYLNKYFWGDFKVNGTINLKPSLLYQEKENSNKMSLLQQLENFTEKKQNLEGKLNLAFGYGRIYDIGEATIAARVIKKIGEITGRKKSINVVALSKFLGRLKNTIYLDRDKYDVYIVKEITQYLLDNKIIARENITPELTIELHNLFQYSKYFQWESGQDLVMFMEHRRNYRRRYYSNDDNESRNKQNEIKVHSGVRWKIYKPLSLYWNFSGDVSLNIGNRENVGRYFNNSVMTNKNVLSYRESNINCYFDIGYYPTVKTIYTIAFSTYYTREWDYNRSLNNVEKVSMEKNNNNYRLGVSGNIEHYFSPMLKWESTLHLSYDKSYDMNISEDYKQKGFRTILKSNLTWYIF